MTSKKTGTIHRKIATKIWWDDNFRLLSDREKMDVILKISNSEDAGVFNKYAGPMFRVALYPKRRPDLSSAKWRRIRNQIIKARGTRCEYCGDSCDTDPTVDHVKPVCSGIDPYDISNLVVSCRPCNSRKGGKEGWA